MRISDWSSDVCSSDLLEAGAVEGAADGADAAVHHVRRRDHVAAGARLHQRLVAQHLDRLVIEDAPVAQQAVVAVAVVGVERDIADDADVGQRVRSEEHTSELQSLMRISYAVFCLKKKKKQQHV